MRCKLVINYYISIDSWYLKGNPSKLIWPTLAETTIVKNLYLIKDQPKEKKEKKIV